MGHHEKFTGPVGHAPHVESHMREHGSGARAMRESTLQPLACIATIIGNLTATMRMGRAMAQACAASRRSARGRLEESPQTTGPLARSIHS
jgi:hypothetical protein